MAMSIRVGDLVEVVRGTRNRNPEKAPTRGRVLSVDRDSSTVVVEGVNLRTRHLRKSPKHPQGGRLRREASISWSNVMVVTADGAKLRLSKAARVDGKVVPKSGAATSATKAQG